MELKQPLLNDYPQQKRTYKQKCLNFALGLMTTLFCLLPTTSMAEENTCTGLKKINNLDELLYQIYTNLDSDCLFTMPLAELEKAWGIKIISEERRQPGQKLFEIRESIDFGGKPYHAETDAFYVEAYHRVNGPREFSIRITETYYKMHATLFPEGNFPKLLPEPIEKQVISPPSYSPGPEGSLPRYPQNSGRYSREYDYYWLNTNRTRMILISPGPIPSVTRITVYDQIPANFIKEYLQDNK